MLSYKYLNFHPPTNNHGTISQPSRITFLYSYTTSTLDYRTIKKNTIRRYQAYALLMYHPFLQQFLVFFPLLVQMKPQSRNQHSVFQCVAGTYISLHYSATLVFREIMDCIIGDKKKDHVHRHVKAKHEAGWKTQAIDTP